MVSTLFAYVPVAHTNPPKHLHSLLRAFRCLGGCSADDEEIRIDSFTGKEMLLKGFLQKMEM
jgi:hypothetical protein